MLTATTDTIAAAALDGLAARHRAYVNNLANAETPGFTPSDVPFEAQLQRARDQITAGSGTADQPPALDLTPVEDKPGTGMNNGSGVDIDAQVTAIEENSLTYSALVEALHTHDAILRSAITEGH